MLDPGADWNRARAQLLALPGIGPWTAEMIAMRGLGDPDAFPASDMGVVKGGGANSTFAISQVTRWRGGRGGPTPRITYGRCT